MGEIKWTNLWEWCLCLCGVCVYIYIVFLCDWCVENVCQITYRVCVCVDCTWCVYGRMCIWCVCICRVYMVCVDVASVYGCVCVCVCVSVCVCLWACEPVFLCTLPFIMFDIWLYSPLSPHHLRGAHFSHQKIPK